MSLKAALLLLFFCFLFSVAVAARGQISDHKVPGGYNPAPTTDPDVKAAVNFAVTQFNKNGEGSLKFVKVISAYKQVVAGVNYRIQISAPLGKAIKTYNAVVFKSLSGVYKLVSFQKL